MLRYASVGAKVEVFCLGLQGRKSNSVAVTTKASDTLYQPPDCSMSLLNGLWVPHIVRVPIDLAPIDEEWLANWHIIQG